MTSKQKSPAEQPGFSLLMNRGLSGLVLDQSLAALGLGTAARALGERRLDLLDGLGLGDAVDRGNLARQPIERGLVELAFAVGLLGLRLGAIKVAHHLGDCHDVAGVDLGLVFLRPARPHGALDARAALEGLERLADHRALGELAHADRGDLRGRDPQRHLVLDEIDDEQLELVAGDFLFLDGDDLADAMGRVNDKLVGLEALTLGRPRYGGLRRRKFDRTRSRTGGGLPLLSAGSAAGGSLVDRFAAPHRLGLGGSPIGCLPRSRPPARAGGFLDGALLHTLTRFTCHSSRVGHTLPDTIPRKIRKNSSPAGAPRILLLLDSYITHFRQESKP